MRGIILAGGTGSRLYPLTKVINKHLIPVGGIPMIYHAIYKLVQADITDILIITGIEHCGTIISQCGDLTASAYKRKMGIKDYGNLIPGHGGIMDRFDSVLFTAPFVYYYIVLISQ